MAQCGVESVAWRVPGWCAAWGVRRASHAARSQPPRQPRRAALVSCTPHGPRAFAPASFPELQPNALPSDLKLETSLHYSGWLTKRGDVVKNCQSHDGSAAAGRAFCAMLLAHDALLTSDREAALGHHHRRQRLLLRDPQCQAVPRVFFPGQLQVRDASNGGEAGSRG